MRYLLFFLLLLPLHCLSQHATIAATKMNALYIGVPNPVSFTVENIKCSQLKIVVENGTAERTGDCEYNIMVTKPGKTTVSLIKGKDVVYKAEFRVKHLPDPICDGISRRPYILLDSLRSKKGLVALSEDFAFDGDYSIVSFETSVLMNKEVLAKDNIYCSRCLDKIQKESYEFISFGTNSGSNFNDSLRMFIQKDLKVGDKVFIENIKAKGPDGSIRHLNQVMFVVQ